MRYFTLLFFFIFGIHTAKAQFDTSPGNSMAIPRARTPAAPKPTPTPIPADSPSPFSLTPKKESGYLIGSEPKTFSMIEEPNKFVNRSSEYADRVEIKGRGESSEAFKGNQYFGEFKTKSSFVQVLCRDYSYEDGDKIKVLVNDRPVVAEIVLSNNVKGVQITLAEGFNKIDFEALNQGSSGPNTAEFTVYDDKEKVISSNQWNLATGFKASVIIIKE